jgi:hypothetical protein
MVFSDAVWITWKWSDGPMTSACLDAFIHSDRVVTCMFSCAKECRRSGKVFVRRTAMISVICKEFHERSKNRLRYNRPINRSTQYPDLTAKTREDIRRSRKRSQTLQNISVL